MKKRLALLAFALVIACVIGSIHPSHAMAKRLAAGWHNLDIYTSNVKNAGTDGIIDMVFYGTNGSVYIENLGYWYAGNQFERNQTDHLGNVFEADLGIITGVRVWNFNEFIFDDDWHLGWIRVTQPGGVVYTCNFNNWVDGGESVYLSCSR